MKSRLALVILAAFLALAPAASANTTRCTGNRYGGITPRFRITNELATNLPRLTSGYAPRCLVADSVVGEVENGVGSNAFRRCVLSAHNVNVWKCHVGGARWEAGVWTVRFKGHFDQVVLGAVTGSDHVVATHGRERVSFNMST